MRYPHCDKGNVFDASGEKCKLTDNGRQDEGRLVTRFHLDYSEKTRIN